LTFAEANLNLFSRQGRTLRVWTNKSPHLALLRVVFFCLKALPH
jgi:hypothetical protein